MADGLDRGYLSRSSRHFVRGRILEPTTTTVSGSWFRIGGIFPAAITVGGSDDVAGLAWKVLVSAKQGDAPDSDQQFQYGDEKSGPDGVILKEAYEWAKIVVTGLSAGSAYGDLYAAGEP